MKKLSGLLVAVMLIFVGCNRAETPAPAPETPAAPAPTAHANLAQLMQGIPFPASNIIFDTQVNDPGAKPKEGADAGGAATSLYGGVYGGWVAVENAALALQETANLIMIPGRVCQNGKPVPVDQADFRMWAAGLADAGAQTLKAAKSRNLDAMVEVSGVVSDACANCHNKYRETPKQPEDRCTP
jgi:hypothetical protein